jgi:alkanesulfonate monooxygenase SsuD/methylene tetrahydromethanopterin reductase-like flavin-dependent oxidoreductase (luciferase family)
MSSSVVQANTAILRDFQSRQVVAALPLRSCFGPANGTPVKYGIYVPNCAGFGSPRELVDLAQRAEGAGWDGFFMWDLLTAGGVPVADTQITLGAVAASTTSIKFGPMVTPLGRRRPWKLAREIATLAEIALGRFVMGCSVGSRDDFAPFPGEACTGAERVARFIDAVEIIRQMLSGSPVRWVQSEETARTLGQPPASVATEPFLPSPAKPVRFWAGASTQREGAQRVAPFRRAAALFDGLFPVANPFETLRPISVDEFVRSIEYAFEGEAPPEGFDLVASGSSLTRTAAVSLPDEFATRGATWWLETFPDGAQPAAIHTLIGAGPPRG